MKSTILCLVGLCMLVGCNLNPTQAKVVAKNAGLATAVTWVAYDNPSKNEIQVVSGILDVIDGVAVNTQNGSSYSETLYPIVENHINKLVTSGKLKENEKPLALAGSLALLSGIDLLFASNPKWSEDSALAVGIVSSFTSGAKTGLGLSDNDPRMAVARNGAMKRARVFKAE